ncbi:MAG: Gfo/Idh/MocA family protein [Gammaproteobacteria bacterium]
MKVAVIGCGSIGVRYVQWLVDLGVDVIAQDVDPARVASLVGTTRLTVATTLDEVLCGRPDRVLVATPPNAHASVACAALEAGAGVLVEKPIAVTLEDAARVVEAAERLQRLAWVVCNMRFHDGPRTLKASLARIGTPLFGRAHFGHRLSQMRPTDRKVYASSSFEGGGVVLDCIHEIDYLQWLFGEVDTVEGWLGQIGPERIDAEDYAEILLRFISGVRVALHLDFLMRRKRRGAEIIGTKGNLVWRSEGRAPEDCTVSFGDHQGEQILLHNPQVDAAAGYLGMLRAFLDTGKGLQTVAEGYRALTVALRAKGLA